MNRIGQIQNDVATFLAEMAVLKAFMPQEQPNGVVEKRTDEHSFERIGEEPIVVLTSLSDVAKQLADNLKNIGVVQGYAIALAREILAAFCVGQWVLFEGSLGEVVVKAVARSLFCKNISSFSVPLGLASPSKMSEVLSAAQSDAHNAIIVHGANRSCVSAYAEPIQQLVTTRLVFRDSAFPQIALLGTITSGASSLVPDRLLTSLGPIFNTDYMPWQWNKTKPLVAGQIGDVRLPIPAITNWQASEELQELLKPFNAERNALWSRGVVAAYALLEKLTGSESGPTPLESLTWGWILPRAAACNLELPELGDHINLGKAESSDQRLIAYLETLKARQSEQ